MPLWILHLPRHLLMPTSPRTSFAVCHPTRPCPSWSQGLCPRGAVPNYGKIVEVTIPQLSEEGEVTKVQDNDSESQEKEEDNLQAAYHDIKTKTVQLEERNVFCGCYNIHVLLHQFWDIQSDACLKIFYGHRGTVTCLDLHEEHFVSGARDGTLKVWDLELGKCLRTLKHGSPVWAAKLDGQHIISGCERGMVKVWRADTGTLIKTLEGHQGPVKCLALDQWHLVTGSSDGYVMGWSMLGKLKRCLIAFCHPKEVLSLEFLYLQVISGCADGKIRVFNYLTGRGLKVLTASSRGDPVSSFCVAEDRMVINIPSSLLLYEFEDVWWDYTLATD